MSLSPTLQIVLTFVTFITSSDAAIQLVDDPLYYEPPDAPDNGRWTIDYLSLFQEAVEEHGLNKSDANLLAFLYAATNDTRYGHAAANSLAAAASDVKPLWLTNDRSWDAPNWTRWDLNSHEFEQPARFSGCTDYGLPGYWMLARTGFDLQWTSEQHARFKHMHQTLCYVWFDGAWNQGTWAGIGNAMLSRLYPDTASQTTPWMYPFLTRAEHAKKVYEDYFTNYEMMEDADGYNQIWTVMMLMFPEVVGAQDDLRNPAVAQLLGNFRDYIAPDGQIFQFASGLNSHYVSLDHVAAFERAAQLTGDGTFRFAARQIYSSMLRQNQTISSLVAAGSASIFWPSTFGLLCGNFQGSQACGAGWSDSTINPIPPSTFSTPSSVVHRRREPGNHNVADKIVMSQSREYGSNSSFLTIAAHTGSSLYHSHSVDVGAVVNFWQGGARFLGAPGKHDASPDHSNQIVLQRSSNTSKFPMRGVGDMFSPGHLTSLFLPVRTHLPMLDQAGLGYLLRNFSALGFTCVNFLNHSVNVTIYPLHILPKDRQMDPLIIDSFVDTSHLWFSEGKASVVQDPTSSSGKSLKVLCQPNMSDCGPVMKQNMCPAGCIFDRGWCHSTSTTYVNRSPSLKYPLPTEHDPNGTINVEEYEILKLDWTMDPLYRLPDAGTSEVNGGLFYPIGIQTTSYPAFSNKTYHYFGNEVITQLGQSLNAAEAIQAQSHPVVESLSEGEYYPKVSYTNADIKGKDMQSMLVVSGGFHTQRTGLARQIVALDEGPVIVIDSLTPDSDANGWTGGPSWAVVAGGDTGSEIHRKTWPTWWQRPNITARGDHWVDFTGFQKVFSPTPSMSDKGFLLVLPQVKATDKVNALATDVAFGVTMSNSTPSDCAEQLCPLYPAWFVHGTTRVATDERSVFVTVLWPHGDDVDVRSMADSVIVSLSENNTVSVKMLVHGVYITTVSVVADRQTKAAAPWVICRSPTNTGSGSTCRLNGNIDMQPPAI